MDLTLAGGRTRLFQCAPGRTESDPLWIAWCLPAECEPRLLAPKRDIFRRWKQRLASVGTVIFFSFSFSYLFFFSTRQRQGHRMITKDEGISLVLPFPSFSLFFFLHSPRARTSPRRRRWFRHCQREPRLVVRSVGQRIVRRRRRGGHAGASSQDAVPRHVLERRKGKEEGGEESPRTT